MFPNPMMWMRRPSRILAPLNHTTALLQNNNHNNNTVRKSMDCTHHLTQTTLKQAFAIASCLNPKCQPQLQSVA